MTKEYVPDEFVDEDEDTHVMMRSVVMRSVVDVAREKNAREYEQQTDDKRRPDNDA